jgi:hypothetical protein
MDIRMSFVTSWQNRIASAVSTEDAGPKTPSGRIVILHRLREERVRVAVMYCKAEAGWQAR